MKKSAKWILTILGAVAITSLLRVFLTTSYLVPSEGMENTLFKGERILVNKWSYGFRCPWLSVFNYKRWNEKQVQLEDIAIFNNPANYTAAALDQKEIFIGRCTGLPGDTLWVDSLYHTYSKYLNPDQKLMYQFHTTLKPHIDSLSYILNIHSTQQLAADSAHYVQSFSRYESYLLQQYLPCPDSLKAITPDSIGPLHPIIVPGKGITLTIHPLNKVLLCNTLAMHEHINASLSNDTLFIDGKAIQSYQFTKNYYWFESNNTANTLDSSRFGFVPHDHLIGKASYIWFSKEKNSPWYKGFRWQRIFIPVQ